MEHDAVVEALAGEVTKLATVFGASSSNSSIAIAPWFVCRVAMDMARSVAPDADTDGADGRRIRTCDPREKSPLVP